MKPADDLTPQYVRDHWSEVAERARHGLEQRVPADGVAVVPLRTLEAMREWGRQTLGRVLDEGKGMNEDLTEDELAELVDQELQAVRTEHQQRGR